MKRLLPFFLLLPLALLLTTPPVRAVLAKLQGVAAVGASESCTTLVDISTGWDDYYGGTTDNFCQKIKNSVSTEVCSAGLTMWQASGSSDVHFEIWDDEDKSVGSQIGGDSTTVAVTTASTDGVLYEGTWSTYPNPTGDYFVHLVVETNGVNVKVHTSGTTYEDTDYDGWRGNNGSVVDLNVDFAFKLSTMQ